MVKYAPCRSCRRVVGGLNLDTFIDAVTPEFPHRLGKVRES